MRRDYRAMAALVIMSLTKRIPFSNRKVLAGDGEHETFLLQPGDIRVVPYVECRSTR